MVGRILLSVCVVLLAGCTALARPAAPAQAPHSVLGATAEPRATAPAAPLAVPHARQPTLAPDVGRPRSASDAAKRVAHAIDSLDLAEMRRRT